MNRSIGFPPRVIWTLWLQGWDNAPAVVRACLASWQNLNLGWHVHALDAQALSHFLPASDIDRIMRAGKPLEAISDQVRIELLHRYGGVWADATAMCMRPLDQWLPASMPMGFFAFSNPTTDRMIASWFLAAEKGNPLIESWRTAVSGYWSGRNEPDDYFWFHKLFGRCYATDADFMRDWDGATPLPAAHEGHFAPNDRRLTSVATSDQIAMLDTPPSPVFKLTHKLGPIEPGSFLDRLITRQKATPAAEKKSKRLLVTWYGSFAGHGTIGDLRSLETIVTHLVARGHEVSHATAASLKIEGASRVDWQSTEASDYNGVIFVCGPVLNSHPQTNALFARFKESRLAGVGVSLLTREHRHFLNPFEFVLARQGAVGNAGDVAIAAPLPVRPLSRRRDIGVALRGAQTEYGEDICRWQETEAIAGQLAENAAKRTGGNVVAIENHLERSGRAPDEIEQQYARCALVITSRFHGAITALRHNTPYIAIDQITGGAKVAPLLETLPWPHVHRIDELNRERTRQDIAPILEGRDDHLLHATRVAAVSAANSTLRRLDDWVFTLV